MEFKFDSSGFLTDRSCDLEAAICGSFNTIFGGIDKINRSCHELLSSADIRSNSDQKVLASILFLRALGYYQATRVLLGRGIVASSRVCLRACMEAVFRLKAIVNDESFTAVLVKGDEAHLKKSAKRAKNGGAFDELSDSDMASLDDFIGGSRGNGVKPLSVEEWSKRAGMHPWYLTIYPLLSSTVHAHVRDLERHLKLASSGKVESFLYAPDLEDIPNLLLTSAECILIGASAFDGVFEVGFESVIKEHKALVEAGFAAIKQETACHEAKD